MRDCNVGKMRVYGFYNLIIVVRKFLELKIKVVQPGDKLHLRGVTFENLEAFREDTFDDKTAPVMFQSGFRKHLFKPDIFLRRKFKIVPMDTGIGSCWPSGSLFSGCHSVGS